MTLNFCLFFFSSRCSFICKDYWIKKSTSDTSVLTFVAGYITSAIWLKYGLLTSERSLIYVNSVGVATMLAYTICFYLFTVKKRETLRIFCLANIFLASVLFYTSVQSERHRATEIVGVVGIGVSLVFFASPLANLAHVVKVKNSESLPFSMILSSFVVTLLWFVYGCLIEDAFIQVPNFIGCVLLVAQLLLFVVYPAKSPHYAPTSGPAYKPLDLT